MLRLGGQFAAAVEARDIAQTLGFLEGLKSLLTATDLRFLGDVLASEYFLVMDLIRCFGPVELTKDQLVRIKDCIQLLLETAINGQPSGWHDKLPAFPGLSSLPENGINVYHVLAIYTKTDPLKAEVFFSVLKRMGYATERLLRGQAATHGSLPLHLAAEVGNERVALDILNLDREQISIKNNLGQTACQLAEVNGHSALAAKLRGKERLVEPKRGGGGIVEQPVLKRPKTITGVVKSVGTDMLAFLQTQVTSLDVEQPYARASPSAHLTITSTHPQQVGNEETTANSSPGPTDPRLAVSTTSEGHLAAPPEPTVAIEISPRLPETTVALIVPTSASSGPVVGQSSLTGEESPRKRAALAGPRAVTKSSLLTSQIPVMMPSKVGQEQPDSNGEDTEDETTTPVPEKPVGGVTSEEERLMSESAELDRLRIFVRTICERCPGGVSMSDTYFKFLMRLGVARIGDLVVHWKALEVKFPSWMREHIQAALSSR